MHFLETGEVRTRTIEGHKDEAGGLTEAQRCRSYPLSPNGARI